MFVLLCSKMTALWRNRRQFLLLTGVSPASNILQFSDHVQSQSSLTNSTVHRVWLHHIFTVSVHQTGASLLEVFPSPYSPTDISTFVLWFFNQDSQYQKRILGILEYIITTLNQIWWMMELLAISKQWVRSKELGYFPTLTVTHSFEKSDLSHIVYYQILLIRFSFSFVTVGRMNSHCFTVCVCPTRSVIIWPDSVNITPDSNWEHSKS